MCYDADQVDAHGDRGSPRVRETARDRRQPKPARRRILRHGDVGYRLRWCARLLVRAHLVGLHGGVGHGRCVRPPQRLRAHPAGRQAPSAQGEMPSDSRMHRHDTRQPQRRVRRVDHRWVLHHHPDGGRLHDADPVGRRQARPGNRIHLE